MATASPTAKAVACLESLYRSSSRKLLSQYATAKAEYKQSFPNGDFDARLGGELRAALDRLAHQSHGNSELDGLQGKIAACWGVSVEQLRTAMDNCASVQFFRNISKFAAATDFDTALRLLTEQRIVRLGARRRGNRRDAGWMPADSERVLKALKPAQVPDDDDDADEPETARNALSELSDLSDHTYESLFSAADSDSDAEPEPPSKKRRTSPAAEEDEGPTHSVVEDEMSDQAPPCYPHGETHVAIPSTPSRRPRVLANSPMKRSLAATAATATTAATDTTAATAATATPATLATLDVQVSPAGPAAQVSPATTAGPVARVSFTMAATPAAPIAPANPPLSRELLTVEEKQRVLERLCPLIWLNDLTVNHILDLITAPLKSYQNVNSLCFTPNRPAKPGFIRSETAVLIMPIHVLAAHWVLASYNRELGQVQTLDSMSSLPKAARAVEQRVKAFVQQQLGRDRLVYVQRACPQQSNGSDCGVYMLAMALYVISGRLPPQQLDATFWRGALAVLIGSNAPDDEDVPLASRNTQDLPSTMARLFQERIRYTNAMDLHACLSFLQSNSVNIAEIQASINDVQNEVALLVDLQTVGSKISDQTRSVNMALLAEDISNAQSRERYLRKRLMLVEEWIMRVQELRVHVETIQNISMVNITKLEQDSYDSSAHVKMMENVSKSMEKQNITKLEEELARLHVKTIPC
ncbi:hypothetical protein SLS56_008813 [Neofusicoccum ribis]|uniref:Ubiquitin-like protease family profile domain-containing protein n=1 Tax=Neofusicoccum ribis TaxID=45134 RepID=A0ABR3SJ34_9PEZI